MARGAPVQVRELLRGGAAELGVEQLAEQRVVAIPLPAPVEWCQQRAAVGQLGEPAMTVAAIGQRVRVCFEEAKDPKSGELLRIPQWEVLDV